MKVQIYTMQSPEEALAVVAAGVDHIGITPSSRGLPGEIDLETARRIVEAVGSSAVRVALTVESDVAEIVKMVEAVRPDVLHLCGLRGDFLPPQVASLRERIPGVAIMQAISVSGPEAIAEARDYAAVADYLILDTQAPDIAGIGASGKTHDWNISREIVRQSRIPVILAGGLGPDNVAEAIRQVHPWGVDSLTRTNQSLSGGGFRKDIALVRQFAEAARKALAE